jgi:hypothetical protein
VGTVAALTRATPSNPRAAVKFWRGPDEERNFFQELTELEEARRNP